MHGTWQAMVGWAIDPEIRGRFAATRQFGTYSGVIRDERAVRKARPVRPDGRIEHGDTSSIDIEVVAVDPLHVGAKSHAAGKIERDMDAEPTRHRRRIDETAECRPPGVGKVVSLSEYESRHAIRRIAFGGTRELLSAVTSRIHDGIDRERSRLQT